MSILQDIFRDHYEEMIYTLHPRSSIIENVDKMINCGNPSSGGAMYGCSHCGELKFVPFRCHSKFCPTCGNKYCIDRSSKMAFKLIHCDHRHLIFTIDEDLRQFFLDDRSLLHYLFQAVRSVILELFHKLNKSKNFVPGSYMYFTRSGDPWNGTHIFTAFLPKAVSLMMDSGALSNTLITHTSAKLFRLLR